MFINDFFTKKCVTKDVRTVSLSLLIILFPINLRTTSPVAVPNSPSVLDRIRAEFIVFVSVVLNSTVYCDVIVPFT